MEGGHKNYFLAVSTLAIILFWIEECRQATQSDFLVTLGAFRIKSTVAMTSELSWSLIEAAVMRDRGYNEEQCLADIFRSFLARRGFSETLAAFDSEWSEISGTPDCGLAKSGETSEKPVTRPAPSRFIQEVTSRKETQLLCLQERYEEAAVMLPKSSVLRIKLLCMAAFRLKDEARATEFLTRQVAPLIPACDNTHDGHQLYIDCLHNILSRKASAVSVAHQLAEEVNDALLPAPVPSALNVLLSWADWQGSSKSLLSASP